ncbi:MAG: cell wall hydrolase [Alphaproteobacteria bacterium]|nr:cell wall hydrolase [Alphaproteobacteria bacterium]
MNFDTVQILARTIYGEARGEYFHSEGGLASLIAVGNVVMNRYKIQNWFGKSIKEICHKPAQFSCWNEGDPNRHILLQKYIEDPIFQICQEVALKVIEQQWPDLTKGSDHYHAAKLKVYPPWARGRTPKVRIANHLFYQLGIGD